MFPNYCAVLPLGPRAHRKDIIIKIMDIVLIAIIGFVLCWWIVQIAGYIVAGRKIDDPFGVSNSDISSDK